MSARPGLRARKKEQTRQAIAEAARRLFAERGFEAVTVAEVAHEAEVSDGTVFNYFATKEDLFYGEMEAFEAELLEAVRGRAVGESVPAAFRRFVLERSVRLAREDVADVISTAAGIIAASPTLRAREREIVAQYTDSLARLIAEETRAGAGDIVPAVVANALMGVQRALVAHVHASVLDGRRGPGLAAEVRSRGKRAFGRLEQGLAGYGVKKG